jgi:hypothetical protein
MAKEKRIRKMVTGHTYILTPAGVGALKDEPSEKEVAVLRPLRKAPLTQGQLYPRVEKMKAFRERKFLGSYLVALRKRGLIKFGPKLKAA